MNDYAQMAVFALMAFCVAVALPAIAALLAGIVEYLRARRDRHEVETIVGDVPRVPPQARRNDRA